jgi:molecular chaperone HscA
MLQASISHASEDIQQRQYQEALVDARAILDSVEKALIADADLLDESELTQINHACMKLRIAIEQKPLELDSAGKKIRQLVEELNQSTDSFAAKRMDKAINQALTGKEIADIDS